MLDRFLDDIHSEDDVKLNLELSWTPWEREKNGKRNTRSIFYKPVLVSEREARLM